MKNGKYNIIYTQFVQCLWMGIIVFNMFSYKDSKFTKVAIIILGLYIFETMFEARSRYIFVYVPLYILIGVMGIKNSINWISKKSKKIIHMKKIKNMILCIGK